MKTNLEITAPVLWAAAEKGIVSWYATMYRCSGLYIGHEGPDQDDWLWLQRIAQQRAILAGERYV